MGHPLFRNAVLVVALVCVAFGVAACGSGVQGTYTGGGGAFMLELKSGGQADLTFMGETSKCTYKVNGKKIALACQGDNIMLTIHDDGSLTGPPGSFVGVLRKTK